MGVLLGKMALERDFITQDQLRDALIEQGRDVEERGMSRPLGVILVSKGFLSEPILLTLLEEQRAYNLDPDRARKRDHSLGQLLLKRGDITQQQLNECIRIQGQAVENKDPDVPRLGELLVQKGFTTPAAVTLALSSQKKVMLVCEKCGKRFNATGYTPTRRYHCKDCGGYLVPMSEYKTTHVDSDVFLDPSMGSPAGGMPAVTDELGKTPLPVAGTPTPGNLQAVPAAPPPVARIVHVRNPWVPVYWIAAAAVALVAAIIVFLKFAK